MESSSMSRAWTRVLLGNTFMDTSQIFTAPFPELEELGAANRPEHTWLRAIVFILSFGFTGFYGYNYSRGRAQREELLASVIITVIYFQKIIFGSIGWVSSENGMVPVGTYILFLLTSPLLLLQYTKIIERVTYHSFKDLLATLILTLQISVTFYSFAAVSVETQKWLFFVIGMSLKFAFYLSMSKLYTENKKNFPVDVRGPLFKATVFFYFCWGTYPLLWILGPAGLGTVSISTDITLNLIDDIISKIMLPYSLWVLKWWYLEDERVVETGRILISRNLSSGASADKFRLTPEELEIARTAPFHVLLVHDDLLVQKLVSLLLNKLNMTITFAFDLPHAVEIIKRHPSYLFDCVLVDPSKESLYSFAQLLKFSEFVTSSPYKIALLASYFNLDENIKDPGECIHGFLKRPLDHKVIKEDILYWRITSNVWRRIAITMRDVKSDEVFPELRNIDLPYSVRTSFKSRKNTSGDDKWTGFLRKFSGSQTFIPDSPNTPEERLNLKKRGSKARFIDSNYHSAYKNNSNRRRLLQ
eukprot:snap_masked-scaffold_1-processed-gene-5.30-mRNA-1 protein AED:1.00 eAED:1.00 QI:0/-1/0/0/-1/1/1/0/529